MSVAGESYLATARDMGKTREARRAFKRFHSLCFWSYRPDLRITAADVSWVAEQLMKHGNREAWQAGARLLSKRSTQVD